MMHYRNLSANDSWAEDLEDLLPEITALIIEGIHDPHHQHGEDCNFLIKPNVSDGSSMDDPVGLPLTESKKRVATLEHLFAKRPEWIPISVTHHRDPMMLTRSLIGGLSHNFNNLLMGIWGHVSLISMALSKNHPVQNALKHMEALIQNGANMIHLLFGYIIERRSTTKKLRFRQLVQEVDDYNQISGNAIDFADIEAGFVDLSNVQDRFELASRIASVLDMMLTFLHQRRMHIADEMLKSEKAGDHLEKIDMLLDCGFHLTRDLKLYASDIAPNKQRVELKSVVQLKLAEMIGHKPSTAIVFKSFSPMVLIDVDPDQIAYALKHVVDNAIEATADSGTVRIQVNTLESEAPEERCGVHTVNNYAVITIADNGKGMAKHIQARIFDPFFTKHNGQGKRGLGLAVSAAIIKSHGGYIQTRSKPGLGSTFKIYLPMQD